MKPQQRTADELRGERSWRQRALAAGAVDPKQMAKISREVREIDAELSRRGERSW
jgi:hypothetical protein